jgi:hypothetical protein
MDQPAITGYRKLSDAEGELMNRIKAHANEAGEGLGYLIRWTSSL